MKKRAPEKPARRGTYRHGDLRRALLEAGVALAREGGPEAIVLREATRRAGVVPNAAYRHFASRDDLLQAVRSAALAELARAIEAKEAPARSFNTAALNTLRNYHWPGNLLQLESVVKTVAQLAPGGEIGVADVTNALLTLDAPLPTPAQTLALDGELRDARDAFERVYFEYHLTREGGNMSRVAERVGLERTHLYRKLKQLGVKLPRRADE